MSLFLAGVITLAPFFAYGLKIAFLIFAIKTIMPASTQYIEYLGSYRKMSLPNKTRIRPSCFNALGGAQAAANLTFHSHLNSQ